MEKNIAAFSLFCFAFCLITAGSAIGQVPETISFQGVLLDGSGNPRSDGQYDVFFSIYDSETGSESLWSEGQTVTVVGGVFSVYLGEFKPIEIDFDRPFWLGTRVEDEAEAEPRIRLTAVPYAFMARAVDDSVVTGAKIASGQVVRSLNELTDEVNLVEGDNMSIEAKDNTIIFSSTAQGTAGGDITGITAGNGLKGGGESGAVTLSVGNGGIESSMLAHNAVKPGNIDSTAAVLSLNDLTGNVSLVPGQNISIEPKANTLIIESTGGGGSGDGHSLDAEDGTPEDAVFVDADGNVGIGSTEPGSKLTVNGVIESTSGGIKFPDGSIQTKAGGEQGSINSLDAEDGSPTNAVFVDKNGDVGIGILVPAERLDVRNSAGDAAVRVNSVDNGVAGLKLFEDLGFGYEFQYDGSSDKLHLWSRRFSGNEAIRMTWLKDGKVGIGTTDPAARLHIAFTSDVAENSGGDLLIGSATGGSLRFDNNEIQAYSNGTATNATLYLQNEGTGNISLGGGSLYVASSDNVGIGTTSPQSTLHISDSRSIPDGILAANVDVPFKIQSAFDAALMFDSNHIESIGQDLFLNSKQNGFDVIMADGGGEVGIGTDEPTQKLDVNGNARVDGDLEVTGTINGFPSGVRTPVAYGHDFSGDTAEGYNIESGLWNEDQGRWEITFIDEPEFCSSRIIALASVQADLGHHLGHAVTEASGCTIYIYTFDALGLRSKKSIDFIVYSF